MTDAATKSIKTSAKKVLPKIVREMHTIDASGRSVGRIATEIALILRGKNKPSFEPHIDAGDQVTIKNVSDMKFTGRKLDQKLYYHYSGYPGGLKTKKMSEVMQKNPDDVLRRAVWNMLPKNKLRAKMIKRLQFVS